MDITTIHFVLNHKSGILACLLVVAGAGLAMCSPDVFNLGGWITAVLLIVFAFIGWHLVLREEKHDES